MTEIQIREKCNNCSNGVIVCDAWVEWTKLSDQALSWYSKYSEEYWLAFDQYIRVSPMPECAEEHTCPDCEGTQWIYRWMPLAEILSRISDLRRAYDGIAGV